MIKKSIIILMVAFLTVGITSFLNAQGKISGSFLGKVTDEKGIALPGVEATVQGPALQGEMSFITSETGAFRFPSLPPGSDYKLTLKLSGFKTVITTGLVVRVGKATNISIAMEMSALEEEITVVGEAPTVDATSSKTAVNYSKDLIYNIPMRRDLYDILNSVPGSVSTNTTYSRTSSISGGGIQSNQYNVDGVSINDPNQMYPVTNINIDVYEEVEMGLFAHSADVGMSDGGFINIVTKSGGNAFHGSATAEYYNKDMQLGILSEDDVKAVGLTKPTGYNAWKDFSLAFGGPIIKDRAWFFTNVRYFNFVVEFNRPLWDESIAAGRRVLELATSPHNEWDLFGKLNFQLAPNIRLTATYNLVDISEDIYRVDPGSVYDRVRGAGAKWDHERGHTFSSQANWVVSQNMFIDFRVGLVARHFPLMPTEGASPDEPHKRDRYLGMRWGGYYIYENMHRNRFNPSITFNLFQDNLFGASHEIKAGFEYEKALGNWVFWRSNVVTRWYYNGSPYAYPTASEPYRSQIGIRVVGPEEGDSQQKKALSRLGFFISDSVTIKDRFTLNLGLRFDTSTASFPAATHKAADDRYGIIAALPGGPGAYGDFSYDDMDVCTWTNFSPRLGFSYDPFGDGKTSIRGSWSRYNAYLNMRYWEGWVHPMSHSEGSWYWYDDNQNGELDSPGIDRYVVRSLPGNPAEYRIEDIVNPDSTAPYTDEFTIGIERELAKFLSFGMTFIYKHKKNLFVEVNNYGLPPDEEWKGYMPDSPYWEKFEFIDPGDDGNFGSADDKTSYCYVELAGAPDKHYIKTNVDGSYEKYTALMLVLNKKMSNRWQLFSSLTFSKKVINLYWLDRVLPNTWVYSEGRDSLDRPINFKIQSTVILPYDFVLSSYFTHMSGSPWNRTVSVDLPDNPRYKYQGDSYDVPTEPSGARRNQSVTILDLRLEKKFRLTENTTIGGYIDILNALGRSGYSVASNPGGYVDYTDPANPTFTQYGNYGNVETAFGNRVIKVAIRFTF